MIDVNRQKTHKQPFLCVQMFIIALVFDRRAGEGGGEKRGTSVTDETLKLD